MRAAFVAFAFSLASIAGASADPNLATIPGDDPDMAQAVQKARASLPAFLEKSRHPAPGMHDFAVKVGLGPSDGREFFWVTPFSVEGDMLSGTLDNEPEVVKGYKKGQTIKVPLTEVSDWTYFVGKKIVGNYSACVLMARNGKAALQDFEKRFGADCATQ